MKLNTLGKVFLFGTLAALLAASFGCERLRDALQKTQQTTPKAKTSLPTNGRPDFYSLVPSGLVSTENEQTHFSSLMLVDPLQRFNPIELAKNIKLEAFQSIVLGGTSREWQKSPLFAIGVYVRDGRLFKINLTALTNKPAPVQISNEENAINICNSKLMANQTAHPDQTFFYYRLAGNNKVCNDTDDTHNLVRLDADSQTDPIGLYNEPIPSYDNDGKLNHWLYASLGKLTASNTDFSINEVVRDGIQSIKPMVDSAFGEYHYLLINDTSFARISLQNNQYNEFAAPNQVIRSVDGAYLIQTITKTNPNNPKEIPGTHLYWWADREPTPKLLSSLPVSTEFKQAMTLDQQLIFVSQTTPSPTERIQQIQKIDTQGKLTTMLSGEVNATLDLYPYITDQGVFYKKTSLNPQNAATSSQDYQFDINKNTSVLLEGQIVDGIVNPSKGRFYGNYAVSSLLMQTPHKKETPNTTGSQLIEYDLNNKTSILITMLDAPYNTLKQFTLYNKAPTLNIAQGNVFAMRQLSSEAILSGKTTSILELISYIPGSARSSKQLTQYVPNQEETELSTDAQIPNIPPPISMPPEINSNTLPSNKAEDKTTAAISLKNKP